MNEDTKKIAFVRHVCAGEEEAEILEAEANFRRFLSLLSRMAKRLAEESGDSGSRGP